MNSARIMSIIIGFIVLTLAACTSDNSTIPSMTCKISQQASDCSSIPTLSSGKLRIMQNGHFSLDGQYTACFHEEAVSIQGQYQRSNYNNSISIELLATKIKGLKSSDFPSTIAVVTLDQSLLKGIISDVWATIRAPMQNSIKHVAEITCKPN